MTTTEKATSTTKKRTTTKTTIQTVAYVGPTIPRTSLIQNTVFNNGIPNDTSTHIEKCSSINKLIIPIDQLAETRSKISQKGTAEYTFFEQIQDYLAGGAK